MEMMLVILAVALLLYYGVYIILSVRMARLYINVMIRDIQQAHAVIESNQQAMEIKNEPAELG